jgi:hypothetical protein
VAKTETDFSQEFLATVRKATGWVAQKHCDRFTTGIPDLSVSRRPNRTVWIESKRLEPRGDKRRKSQAASVFNPRYWIDNEVQLDTLVRLGGWYMIFDAYSSLYLLVRSEVAYRAYMAHELIPETDDGAVCDDDRLAFYGSVILTLTKELS